MRAFEKSEAALCEPEAEDLYVETLIIYTYELGSNRNYYTFALTLLIIIIMCSKFHWNKWTTLSVSI